MGLEPGSKAREYLSFLGNRLLSSAVYLDVMLAADELNKIPRLADGSVPPGNKERALEVCDHVLLYMDRFIETYGRILPDRGSEGLIVSYWNSPVKGLKVIRSRLTGVEMETPPHSDRPIDPPHIPVFEE